ncbi:hypothetical protein OL548_34500 (plasmid) [Lysinibacillus sp. MHQ-1]|nr:hypothetical protein OL548_34500 [Lysinibacillus sp. MHQ-1]
MELLTGKYRGEEIYQKTQTLEVKFINPESESQSQEPSTGDSDNKDSKDSSESKKKSNGLFK